MLLIPRLFKVPKFTNAQVPYKEWPNIYMLLYVSIFLYALNFKLPIDFLIIPTTYKCYRNIVFLSISYLDWRLCRCAIHRYERPVNSTIEI